MAFRLAPPPMTFRAFCRSRLLFGRIVYDVSTREQECARSYSFNYLIENEGLLESRSRSRTL